MVKQYYNSGGINTFDNPLKAEQDGVLIHAVNVDSFPSGAKKKRIGYETFLNNPDSAYVSSLWSFHKNNGTQFWFYRASGSLIYYSQQGTGDWTICGNGTIEDNAHVGHAVMADTMIIGDGEGSTRHTTNGTSFTNTSLAPVAAFFEEYQGRIHAQGTASTNFYSSANDPTNWQTSGTSDSSSFQIPGGGRLLQSFKAADRLIIPKTSGQMYRWDGYALVDLATRFGPSTPYAIGEAEGYRFFVNRYGMYGYGGGQAELLSNKIQRQWINSSGSSVVDNDITLFAGAAWYYNNFVAVGSITDDFTKRPISNAIIKYDFLKDDFLNWSFYHAPTAFHVTQDASGFEYIYFGDANGNTYRVNPLGFNDAGQPIFSEMVFLFHLGAPEFAKKWEYWRASFNPGCHANVQVAVTDNFEYTRLTWQDLGDVKQGSIEYRFPPESRSKLLFVRIYEASDDPPWSFYGQSIEATVEKR